MIRRMEAAPAFHSCHEDPAQDHGHGPVRLTFTVANDERALTFEMDTAIPLSEVQWRAACPDCMLITHRKGSPRQLPHGVAVYFHSTELLYEHQAGPSHCTALPTGKCYSDVSYGASDELFDTFTAHGSAGVYDKMEQWRDNWTADLSDEPDAAAGS